MIGYTWSVCQINNGDVYLLHHKHSIYLIVIKSPIIGIKLVYIGKTKNLQQRIKNHSIIKKLKKYKCTIEVYHKRLETFKRPYNIESLLISKNMPPFNVSRKIKPLYTIQQLLKDLK